METTTREESQEKPRRLGYRGVQVMRFLSLFMMEHGEPPSYTTIMRGCDFSSQADVANCIARLERAGLVHRAKQSEEHGWHKPLLMLVR